MRLNLLVNNAELYFHNYTLQGYSCTLWVWTCDLGCIVEQFMISFFFPLVHDKHLQTSPELTTMTTYSDGVKKKKHQKSPLSFLPPSTLPRSFCTSEVYLASPWGVRWRFASQGNCQLFLVGLAHSQTHSRTDTRTHTHIDTHSSAGLSPPFSPSQWQSLSTFLAFGATIPWWVFPSVAHYSAVYSLCLNISSVVPVWQGIFEW